MEKLPPLADLLRDGRLTESLQHPGRTELAPLRTSHWMTPSPISPRDTLALLPEPTTPASSPRSSHCTLIADESEVWSASLTIGSSNRKDVPGHTMLSAFMGTTAYERILEWGRGLSLDERYERVHQAPTSSTYGDRVPKAKETRLNRKPVREDSRDDSSYRKALKRYTEGESHRIKEQNRRARHFGMQRCLHKMTCEDARSLGHSGPAFVASRNGDMGTTTTATGGGCKTAGKDDQLTSTFYQNLMLLEVCRDEHKGRKEAEALLARYRRNYGDNDDDHTTPRKRRRVDQFCNSSLSPRHPLSPGASPTTSFGYQSPVARK